MGALEENCTALVHENPSGRPLGKDGNFEVWSLSGASGYMSGMDWDSNWLGGTVRPADATDQDWWPVSDH